MNKAQIHFIDAFLSIIVFYMFFVKNSTLGESLANWPEHVWIRNDELDLWGAYILGFLFFGNSSIILRIKSGKQRTISAVR